MRIYIAGSISNNNNNYKEQFANAEKNLIEQGYFVFNPAKNTGFEYKDYVDIGLYELMHCDCIYLLKGYEKSKGASLEKHYAETVGLKIIYQ